MDWVQVFARQWEPHGPLLVALEGVYSATDPPIVALRRVVPPLRIGSVALDLSFLLVMVAAWLLLNVVAPSSTCEPTPGTIRHTGHCAR